jgi:Sulfotransferase family
MDPRAFYADLVAKSDAFRVLCVQNYAASGTLFAQSLLDFHPQTLSLPGLMLRDFPEQWATYSEFPYADRMGRLIAYLEPLFVGDHWQWIDWGTDKLGPGRSSGCHVDRGAFLAHFASLIACDGTATRRRFLCSVYIAFALTLQRKIPPQATLIFPIHGGALINAQTIEVDFPGVLYLHMVRHPISAAVSVARHAHATLSDKAFPVTSRALVQVLSDRAWYSDAPGYGDRAYLSEIGDRAKAFRLEALHERPRETLEAVCTFAGLDWDDCLLRSTFNGLQWWNRAESPQISGFDPALPARGVRERTHALERLAIRLAALPKLIAWRYPDAEPFAAWPKALVSLVFWVVSLVPFRAEFAAPESPDNPPGRAWIRRYLGIRHALWRGYADSRAAAAITVTSGEAA